jgi:hypothetical protein
VRRLVVLASALLAVAVACQNPARPQQVRGLVIAVEARSIAQAQAMTVRTTDGRELRLTIAPDFPWTPGHLREHMATAQPVVVDHVAQGPDLVATRIDDG